MPVQKKSGNLLNAPCIRFRIILECFHFQCCCLLDCLGIPYLESFGEAESYCAFLNAQGVSIILKLTKVWNEIFKSIHFIYFMCWHIKIHGWFHKGEFEGYDFKYHDDCIIKTFIN